MSASGGPKQSIKNEARTKTACFVGARKFRVAKIPLLRHELFHTIRSVMKFGTAAVLLAIALIASACVSAAHADEPRASALQTALSNTTFFENYSPDCDESTDTNIVVGSSMIDAADISSSFTPSSVPEPSSIRLLTMGAVGIIIFSIAKQRRRRSLAASN